MGRFIHPIFSSSVVIKVTVKSICVWIAGIFLFYLMGVVIARWVFNLLFDIDLSTRGANAIFSVFSAFFVMCMFIILNYMYFQYVRASLGNGSSDFPNEAGIEVEGLNKEHELRK